MKFRPHELFLGVFLTIAVFAIGMTFQSSRTPSNPYQRNSPPTPENSADKTTDWLLVGLNFFLVTSTLMLWVANNRSAKTAGRALTDIERAFVHLVGFNFELTTKEDMKEAAIFEGEPEWHRKYPGLVIRRFALQPKWKNSGNTPTRKMTIQIDWRVPPYATREPKYAYRAPPRPFFVPPGAVEPSEVIELSMAQALIDASWNPAKEPPQILIWGRADYEDIFGQKHFVEWCHELRFSRSGGKKMRPGTIQWGKYNRTDEDERA